MTTDTNAKRFENFKGSFHQSRRQSNFYNFLKGEKQIDYAKQWVATINSKLLEPFIKITGATKHNREVFYEIDINRLLNVEEENARLRKALEDIAKETGTPYGRIAKAALKGESE